MAQSNRERAESEAMRFITRRDSGPWSASDDAALKSWLAESASHQAAFIRLEAAWQEAGRLAVLGRAPVVARVSKLPRWLKPLALAASVLLIAGAALFASRGFIVQGNRYSTVVGGLQTIPTSDGSKVTLNTDSQIRLHISEKARAVELAHGEAFFEVAKDPKRPFVVDAGSKRIVAVGTAFSVRRDGDDVRVVVTEGTVRVEPADPSNDGLQASEEAVLLPAGSVARSAAGAVMVQTKSVPEASQSVSWRTGVLTFRNTALADAVAEFNRYNTRKIVIEDPTIAAVEVGGVFRATRIDPFVSLLESGFAIDASEEDGRIVLRLRE